MFRVASTDAQEGLLTVRRKDSLVRDPFSAGRRPPIIHARVP